MIDLDFSWIMGNLALDPASFQEEAGHEGESQSHTTQIPSVTAIFQRHNENTEPIAELSEESQETFLLQACQSSSLKRRVASFKELCNRHRIAYRVNKGCFRVVLDIAPGSEGLYHGLLVKLDYESDLEAALLVELAMEDADLMEILEERAAIRWADGLPGDLESAALAQMGKSSRRKKERGNRTPVYMIR